MGEFTIKTIYFNEPTKEINKELNNLQKPGVWFLIGKNKKQNNSEFECLQVAKHCKIGSEIKVDIGYIKNNNFKIEKIYTNQFGQQMFKYIDYDDNRRITIYKHIAKNFTDLQFICFYGNVFTNEVKDSLEKYIAYQTKARYWVNGRPFNDQLTQEKIDKLSKFYENICKEIAENLKVKNKKLLKSVDDYLEKRNLIRR